MLDVATLGIKVNSTGVVTASKRLNTMTAAGARTERATKKMTVAASRFDGVTQRLTRSLFSLQGILPALGLGYVLRGIIQTTDQFNLASARIRLYTDSLDEATAAQQRLLAVSNETRTDMFSTLELFARVSQARGELNRTTSDLIKFTEQIQKLTVISGANPQEARNAVIQLSQGLSSGELRGEELRAVIEQLPAVARTIADSMGITIGKFRELAFQGKITAQTVVNGILNMADATDAKFREVPVTVGQAWTVLKNNAITAIAEVNNAVQGNQTLAQGLMGAAESVGDAIRGTYLFVAAGFDRVRIVFDEWIMLLEQTGASWEGLKHSADESLTFIGVYFETLGRTVAEGLTHWPENMKAAFTIMIGEVDQFVNNVVAFFKKLGVRIADTWDGVQHSAQLMWLKVKGIFTDQEAAIASLMDVRGQEQAMMADQIALIETERRIKNAASQEAIDAALRERDAIIARMEARIAESKSNREGTLNATTGEVNLSSGGGVVEDTKKKLSDVTQFAIQAARNIQSAFADFFFDPFKDGLKGMLRGFIDIIRRMVAEILAQQVLKSFFKMFEGKEGFWGDLANAFLDGEPASGSRASGGPVQAGKMYQVAEFNKPEFFIPQTNGTMVPADKMGQTIHVTNNIDARGAISPAEVVRIAEASARKGTSDALYAMRRGHLPA